MTTKLKTSSGARDTYRLPKRLRLIPLQILTVLAAIMIAVSDVAPAEAQSEDTLMVGNLEESAADKINVGEGQQYAQSFCAGSASTLSKVRMYWQSSDDDVAAEVTLRADSSGSPGSTLHTLTNPSVDNDLTSVEDFSSSGYALAADTTYWVVVHRPASAGHFAFGVTELYDEYPAEPGWSIGDGLLFTSGGSWVIAFDSPSRPKGFNIRMAVYIQRGWDFAAAAGIPQEQLRRHCQTVPPLWWTRMSAEGAVLGTAGGGGPERRSP